MAEFHSLPTEWNGIQYRSRLEARWAVLFDTLRLRVKYEQDFVRLPSGVGYLPDFYVPLWDAYLEVKPSTSVDLTKPRELASSQSKPVYLAAGEPWKPTDEEDEGVSPADVYQIHPRSGSLLRCRFIECPSCEMVSVDPFRYEVSESLSCKCHARNPMDLIAFTEGIPAILSGLILSSPEVRAAVAGKLDEWRADPAGRRLNCAFHAARESCFKAGLEPETAVERERDWA